MEQVREIKKSFCILSVAYLILGIVLLVWPDLSVRTFCYVFGVGMLIFGCAYLIIYFTKDRFLSVMQPDLVMGVVGVATGAFILLKMEYMLEIIPFALGVVALLGAIVKVQQALDLRRIYAKYWYIMMIWALALAVCGGLLVANPFEALEAIVILIGISLIIDGLGNLISIFWISLTLRRLKKVMETPDRYDVAAMRAQAEAYDAKDESTAVMEVSETLPAADDEETDEE